MTLDKTITISMNDYWTIDLLIYHDKLLNCLCCRMLIFQHESLVTVLYFNDVKYANTFTTTTKFAYSNTFAYLNDAPPYTQTIIELLLKHNIITINEDGFMRLSESTLLKLL